MISLDENPRKLMELKIQGAEHIQDVFLTESGKYLCYSTASRVGCYKLEFDGQNVNLINYMNYWRLE